MTTLLRCLVLVIVASSMFDQSIPAYAQVAANPFDALKKGQIFTVSGQTASIQTRFDKAIGGLFVHVKTGFTVDDIQIQSVPQARLYANTCTVSDMGSRTRRSIC